MAKIVIYGAGSIGCYVGGRLLAGGSDVSFIGRARMADQLRREGITLSRYDNCRWHVPPEQLDISTDAARAAAADLVLVTVKSAATPKAAAELASVLRPGTIVVSFQNGVGNADVLRAALPQHTVLEGMVPFNVVERGPGAFHQGSAGELEIKQAPAMQPFADEFRKARLPLVQHADMLPVQWAKLLLNLNNAINALANRPLKEELSQRAYRLCLAMAQREALALLKQAGIRPARLTPLPATWIPRVLGVPDALFERLGRAMLTIDPLARSSMSDDMAAGRPTEINWINGEVVRLAQRLGQPAPVNERLCELVRQAERSEVRPSWPGDALLAELRAAANATLALRGTA
ncbi:2-dehydropantoate 2-reductase [Paraburkholderia ginsengiterrae]|uniref:2-dehydropantoate 2-reductase n=1 Tax=Paraburkholderia ginsengiterrae TaxID=1462993 RepID=A0A1A9N506_9BURK|nr:2-dehydropantoate 2-reductase [Paraburkholderia ginsengiterrae]OAJ56797.1 2-dehydropantoate 2-reductase [Paraburkholderia ginsengiterrae]OAJ56856.1 2-dehydropantoate 2-reductase [Paraburkholderia ginsengiterrae]